MLEESLNDCKVNIANGKVKKDNRTQVVYAVRCGRGRTRTRAAGAPDLVKFAVSAEKARPGWVLTYKASKGLAEVGQMILRPPDTAGFQIHKG